MPVISVVIPLYNKEPIIERTINSVLSQSFNDFEVIVIDDGSTDGSIEVVKKIRDNRISLIERMNGGPGAARNTGAKVAKGDWIIFLDADDELLPNALQVYSDFATANQDVDIIDCGQRIKKGSSTIFMRHSLNGISKNPYRDWFYHRISPGSNHSLFKKDFVLRYPYNQELRRFEDAELLMRMLQTAKIYSSTISTSLVHTDFSSASKKRKDITEDYVGHLSFEGKKFWAKMLIYRLYLENRELYPNEMRKLYPTWYWRCDLLILCKILNRFQK